MTAHCRFGDAAKQVAFDCALVLAFATVIATPSSPPLLLSSEHAIAPALCADADCDHGLIASCVHAHALVCASASLSA